MKNSSCFYIKNEKLIEYGGWSSNVSLTGLLK